MENISFAPLKGTPSGRGRILTGVFKSGEGGVNNCEFFSKFLAAGFELYHVGINTHSSEFIQKIKKFSPQVLVLLCQGNTKAVRELIEMIKKEQLRSMARIILYGSGIRESIRDKVHADAYAENEQELFDMVNSIVNETYI